MIRAYYVGVDPGVNGGIAYLHYVDDQLRGVGTFRMPGYEKGVMELLQYLRSTTANVSAVLEGITPSFQGTGKASMAKLYGSYMALRMALTAVAIPFVDERSEVVWRGLGIPPRRKDENGKGGRTKWKARLRNHAQSLYPAINLTNHVSDALLLAHYCMIIDRRQS